jgi:amino-acid N-acetyltransferase
VFVRPATPLDAPAIEALIAVYVPSGALLPRSAEFITMQVADFLVVEDTEHAQRVVGCVHLDEYAPSLAEIRSLAVDPASHGRGVGRMLIEGAEALARKREHATLFAVSNDEGFFNRFGYLRRNIPELDRERSEVSRFKGVFAKDMPWAIRASGAE